ncbi:O-methyltransferase, partial [Bacteroidota bacterium]
AQNLTENTELDKKVQQFIDSHPRKSGNMNVPAIDGKYLHDLIVEHKYKSALEIGTSTGHSSIWIAWALSKTGGKLITIEINEGRYKQALSNFKEAGLEKYIDARLTNAHELVPKLEGPFEFVFSDADKDWYINYFKAVDPKLKVKGCYTSHNVTEKNGIFGNREYVEFFEKLPNYKTSYFEKGGGIAVSFKTAEN